MLSHPRKHENRKTKNRNKNELHRVHLFPLNSVWKNIFFLSKFIKSAHLEITYRAVSWYIIISDDATFMQK